MQRMVGDGGLQVLDAARRRCSSSCKVATSHWPTVLFAQCLPVFILSLLMVMTICPHPAVAENSADSIDKTLTEDSRQNEKKSKANDASKAESVDTSGQTRSIEQKPSDIQVDPSRKGRISLNLISDGKALKGIKVRLTKVASLTWSSSSSEWSWTPESQFEKLDMGLLSVNSETELSKAVALAGATKSTKGNTLIEKSEKNGRVDFEGLYPGLYLLDSAPNSSDGLFEFSPFCISLPTKENESYLYEIDATPKVALSSHRDKPEKEQEKKGSSLPKTGDEITLFLGLALIVLSFVALIALVAAYLTERKRNKSQLQGVKSDELMLKLDQCSMSDKNLSQKRSEFTSKAPILALAAILLLGGLLFLLTPREALCVERVDIDTSMGVSSATAFMVGVNQSPTLTMTNGTTKADFDNGNRREITAKIPSSKGSWTVSNPAKLTFSNAGTINKRKVSLTVSIDSVTFKKGGKDTSNGFKNSTYVTIAHMTGSSLFIGCRSKDNKYGISNNNGYTIKTSVTFTWADTGQVIDLPFIQGVYDIDQYDSGESWEANSGFTSYIVYKGTNLTQSGNKFSLSKDYGSLSGDSSKYKGGLYATTHNGSFKSTFYGANCDSQLVLYNQLMQLSPPAKSVDTPNPKPGEEIEWSIDQKMGTYIKDSFTGYTSLSLSDVLDERLEYVSASMLDEKTDITKLAGTLKYDEASRKLTYQFDQSWLKLMSNYKGQLLSLKIKTRVKKETYGQTIPNKAIVSNSNVDFEVDAKVDVPKYEATGSWVPKVTKRLEGAKLAKGQFSFNLLDDSKKKIQEAENKADGEVEFEPVLYDQDDIGKTYEYSIVEENDSQPGITYDESMHKVKVAIADNKDETLSITATYEDGKTPEFVNHALVYSKAPYPTTGGPGFLFAGIGIGLIALGLILKKKRP